LAIQAVLVVILAQLAAARLAAEEHLHEGNAAFLAGRVPEAIAEYETAERLFPSPNISYNLGQAYEAIDRKHEALMAYERFIAGLSTEPQTSGSGPAFNERSRRLENARARADTLRHELTTDNANAPPAVVPAVAGSVATGLPRVRMGSPDRQLPAPLMAQPPSDSRSTPAGSRRRTMWLVGIGLVAVAAISTVILIQRSRDTGCSGKDELGCVQF
jgi:hypothetical protein